MTAGRTRANTIRASVTQVKETGRPRRVRKSTRQRAVSPVGATDAQPDPHNMGRMDQVNPYCEALYFTAKFHFQMVNGVCLGIRSGKLGNVDCNQLDVSHVGTWKIFLIARFRKMED